MTTKRFSSFAMVLAVSTAISAMHCGSSGGSGGSGDNGSSGGGTNGSSSGGTSGTGSSSGSGGNSSSGAPASSSGGSSGGTTSSSGSNGSSSGAASSSGGSSGGGSSGSSSGSVTPVGADACLPQQTDNVAASVNPPNGLMPSQVPQFVMFGADDNYWADGIEWLINTALAGKVNPDGTPAQMTFFITSGGATTDNGGVFAPGSVNQTPQDVLNSWQDAYKAGHEIGNHTWDHDQSDGTVGATYTAAQWQSEESTAQTFLINQVSIPSCELDGWRFPYLMFDDAGFSTIQSAGFLFDASMEFGYNWWLPPGAPDSGYGPGNPLSGQHYWWPMTLDSGPPSGTNDGFDPTETKGVGAHPGFWEFFAETWNSPDPSSADPMNPTTVRTVTGVDYNNWEIQQTQPSAGYNFCQTLEYTFTQRYNGNRAPFNVGLHSTIYSPDDPSQDTFFGNDAPTRRAGLQCFIDFLFSGAYPDVRVVGFHKVIEWMRNPTALSQ